MSEDASERVADGIRRRRVEMGLSQQDLGEKIGLEGRAAGQTISSYETGAKWPRADRLTALCEAMEISLSDLVAEGGDGG